MLIDENWFCQLPFANCQLPVALHKNAGYTRTFCATAISAQKPLAENIFSETAKTGEIRLPRTPDYSLSLKGVQGE